MRAGLPVYLPCRGVPTPLQQGPPAGTRGLGDRQPHGAVTGQAACPAAPRAEPAPPASWAHEALPLMPQPDVP